MDMNMTFRIVSYNNKYTLSLKMKNNLYVEIILNIAKLHTIVILFIEKLIN